MLSRVGNSLFWLGRYIERAEHFARFTRVQYLSALDAPMVQKKQFILESILDMIGYQFNHFDDDSKLSEEEVLHYVCLDENNTDSVIFSVNCARENARGVRDTISSELWESINKYYHTINDYPADEFRKEGPFDFSEIVYQNSSLVKGFIDNTHMHSIEWSLMSLGLHLERCIQITRIILAKLNDIDKIDKDSPALIPITNYQVSTLLKCTESFDMSRKHYKRPPMLRQGLEFLILNHQFPKSISFNLKKAHFYLENLGLADLISTDTPEFELGKLSNSFRYTTIEEIEEENAMKFLERNLSDFYKIGSEIESKYLGY